MRTKARRPWTHRARSTRSLISTGPVIPAVSTLFGDITIEVSTTAPNAMDVTMNPLRFRIIGTSWGSDSHCGWETGTYELPPAGLPANGGKLPVSIPPGPVESRFRAVFFRASRKDETPAIRPGTRGRQRICRTDTVRSQPERRARGRTFCRTSQVVSCKQPGRSQNAREAKNSAASAFSSRLARSPRSTTPDELRASRSSARSGCRGIGAARIALAGRVLGTCPSRRARDRRPRKSPKPS